MSVSGISTSTRLVGYRGQNLSNVEEIMREKELQIARTGNHFKEFCYKEKEKDELAAIRTKTVPALR